MIDEIEKQSWAQIENMFVRKPSTKERIRI